MSKIDVEQQIILQEIYDYFNAGLFESKLPNVIFTIDYHKQKAFGFYHHEKLKIDDKNISVISLNPDHFERENIDCMATIAHEMAHAWQFNIAGKISGGYHDKQWGKKMQSIGLMPSNTGLPEGKKTGQQMHHYIIDGGLFQEKANQFISDHKNIFLFYGIMQIKAASEKKKNKIKYECECGNKAWGKPGLNLICGDCKTNFISYD